VPSVVVDPFGEGAGQDRVRETYRRGLVGRHRVHVPPGQPGAERDTAEPAEYGGECRDDERPAPGLGDAPAEPVPEQHGSLAGGRP
jgi:hypothetical protein